MKTNLQPTPRAGREVRDELTQLRAGLSQTVASKLQNLSITPALTHRKVA